MISPFNQSCHFQLKWKLKKQLAKDQREIILSAHECGENWMFSCTKTFSWILVEVLRWIALPTSTDEPCGIHFYPCRVTGLLRLMKSVIIEDVLKRPESWMSVSIFYSLKTFRSNLIAFFVFSGTPSCILFPSQKHWRNASLRRPFCFCSDHALFTRKAIILCCSNMFRRFNLIYVSVLYFFERFTIKQLLAIYHLIFIYNIDRTQCALWLVENQCFIRLKRW